MVWGLKGGSGKSTIVNILADMYKLYFGVDVSIVELDPQQTLANTYAVGISNRQKPVIESRATKSVVIYDTAGFVSYETQRLLEKANIIVLPTLLYKNDLLALFQAINDEDIISLENRGKIWIVFNKVHIPHSALYKKYKKKFMMKSIK